MHSIEKLFQYTVVLSPLDNVATAIKEVPPGRYQLDTQEIEVIQTVPVGFKVALAELPTGSTVYKFGYPIGFATEPIKAGELVHTHNLKGSI